MISSFIIPLSHLWPLHERQFSFLLPAIPHTSFSSVRSPLFSRRAIPHTVLLATVHICTCSSRQDSHEPQYNEYCYNRVHYFSLFLLHLVIMFLPPINLLIKINQMSCKTWNFVVAVHLNFTFPSFSFKRNNLHHRRT